MSYALDANLLLYASDRSSPWHDRATAFLMECAKGDEIVYVPWPTAMAYLRIATHPRIFESPLSASEATSNLNALLAQPNLRPLSEGPDFWDHYRQVVDTLPVRGNLVPDAHVVAIMKSNGVKKICSRDRDFRKFDGIRVVDPLAE